MPRRKRITSLKQLSMLSIKKNVTFWCRDDNQAHVAALSSANPFSCLRKSLLIVRCYYVNLRNNIRIFSTLISMTAQELIHDILELLYEERPLLGDTSKTPRLVRCGSLKIEHLRLFLQLQTECLKLADDSLPYDELVELISVRCKKLKMLVLTQSEIPTEALTLLPQSLPNLQVLHLRSTKTSDATLCAIGYHLRDLRELDVSYCVVSDDGISALCGISQTQNSVGGCLKLQKLAVKWTRVTIAGALCALNHLPDLKRFVFIGLPNLLHQHFNDSTRENLKNRTLHLEELHFHLDKLTRRNCFEMLELAIKLCPKMANLHVDFGHQLDHPYFLFTRFKYLQELCLECKEDNPLLFDFLAPVLQVVGPRLKQLELIIVLNLDMGFIGKTCCSLKELNITPLSHNGNIMMDTTRSQFQPFSCLETLRMNCFYDNPRISYPHLLHALQLSRNLKFLNVTNCQVLLDKLMREVLKVHSFPHLEHISFDRCSKVSVGTVMALVELPNSLRSLWVILCQLVRHEDYTSVLKKIETENLDVYFYWVEHLPSPGNI